ncbi:MAG: hypothetical protein F4Z04_14900 [Acidobacteria bacterium]|nr:hypothetical protein [Acidobacteriota bacterium]
MWQRPLRLALALSVVAFGVVVGLGVRDRRAPEATVALDGADPDAILQSRGARITLGDGTVIKADQQFAYADGRSRLVAVDVAVPENDERIGLRIRGGEATGSQDEGEWTLSGDVAIETDDGMTGLTDEASYADGDGIVRMLAPARFEQGWMTLTGGTSRYDRRRGLLHLDRQARVRLRTGNDDTAGETRIEADRALVARADGYMRFEGNVLIDAGDRQMAANEAIVNFDPDASRLEGVELTGGARLEGSDRAPGGLRALSAEVITVTYVDGGLDRAAVAGGGHVELHSDADRDGATIAAQTLDLRFAGGSDSDGFDQLRARDGVTLNLPAIDGPARQIGADRLDLELGESVDRTTEVRLDGAVEFREPEPTESGASSGERIIRAERLVAALQDNITRLGDARFSGAVTLETGAVRGVADVATYAPDEATFILLTDEAGNPPRVEDRWGSIQGATVTVRLDGPDIEAVETVRGILQLDNDADGLTTPGLFDEGPPIYATGERFVYDAGESSATYAGQARLWQGETEIRAETISIQELTGNLEARESVTTRTTMVRHDHETGEAAPTTANSRGAAFEYDNEARQISYLGEARLDSDGTDLAGKTITLQLADDARTLEQIKASDEVRLLLDGRRAAGETLSYDDADGRYDMTGTPVRVVEELGGGCRETTGRAVTFYVAGDSVTVDGRAEARTASSTGPCQEF